MNKQQLRQAIFKHFKLDEIKTLSFDLSINFDELGRGNLSEVIIELLGYCERQGMLPELQSYLEQARPKVRWAGLFGDAGESTADPTFPLYHLPTANPHFTGRTALLAQLTDNLSGDSPSLITQMQAISGLGGVGKSQLALAYAHAHKGEYELIWWLTADPEETLGTELAALGRALGLPEVQETAVAVQQVQRWLAGTTRRWLLSLTTPTGLRRVRCAPTCRAAGRGGC